MALCLRGCCAATCSCSAVCGVILTVSAPLPSSSPVEGLRWEYKVRGHHFLSFWNFLWTMNTLVYTVTIENSGKVIACFLFSSLNEWNSKEKCIILSFFASSLPNDVTMAVFFCWRPDWGWLGFLVWEVQGVHVHLDEEQDKDGPHDQPSWSQAKMVRHSDIHQFRKMRIIAYVIFYLFQDDGAESGGRGDEDSGSAICCDFSQ